MCIRDRGWEQTQQELIEIDPERAEQSIQDDHFFGVNHRRLNSLIAVSYTHLDVYKRQEATRCERSGKANRRNRRLSNTRYITRSYIPARSAGRGDVYKRQVHLFIEF